MLVIRYPERTKKTSIASQPNLIRWWMGCPVFFMTENSIKWKKTIPKRAIPRMPSSSKIRSSSVLAGRSTLPLFLHGWLSRNCLSQLSLTLKMPSAPILCRWAFWIGLSQLNRRAELYIKESSFNDAMIFFTVFDKWRISSSVFSWDNELIRICFNNEVL